jgi:Protein of unknown function (DUF2934)
MSEPLDEPTEEQIRERAYEFYLAGGSQDGHDLSDWLTAAPTERVQSTLACG